MTKMILGALALAVAVPAVAQTAPAGDHSAHQGTDHSKHQAGKHDCKECCEKMKDKNGKMECMDKRAEAKGASSDQHDHAAH